MASLSVSKIKHFLNHAPAWLKIPALAIFFCVGSLISKALSYRLRSGGWEMDWAAKFEDSLYSGVIFGLLCTWLTRTVVGKNGQDDQQRS